MVNVPDVYIVGKGKDWLMSSRPDLLELPRPHVWSKNVYDARKFDNRAEAKKKARLVGGVVYLFNQATRKTELLQQKIPKNAVCDTCAGYRPLTGLCRNPGSEFYDVPVSYKGVCEDWTTKKQETEG